MFALQSREQSEQHLAHPLTIDRGAGRLALVAEEEAYVEQLMRQVLWTEPGERINRPDFGCGLRRLVFAGGADASASLVRVTINEALKRWLGALIQVDDVSVSTEDATLHIQIHYQIKSQRKSAVMALELPQP